MMLENKRKKIFYGFIGIIIAGFLYPLMLCLMSGARYDVEIVSLIFSIIFGGLLGFLLYLFFKDCGGCEYS